MSRHEGVSCDSCLKGYFSGRRYKCLLCYDYDLCSACYEAGATSTRHTVEHPVQCILTRADYELYYGGEPINSIEQPQSYTCPFCGKMGFTDTTLQEHVTSEHSDASYEVVCPVCASIPGGEANLMTDDFAGHLTLEHRSGPRDLISFLDEPVSARTHSVRRIPHTNRGASASRSRRSNMHFSSSGGLTSLSPSSRDNVDPIAELLSQLSGVRRSATNTAVARQQLERLPRRQLQSSVTGGGTQTQSATVVREPSGGGGGTHSHSATSQPLTATTTVATGNTLLLNNMQPNQTSPTRNSQFLLAGLFEEKQSDARSEERRAEKSLFVQQLVVSSMSTNENTSQRLAKLFPPTNYIKQFKESHFNEGDSSRDVSTLSPAALVN